MQPPHDSYDGTDGSYEDAEDFYDEDAEGDGGDDDASALAAIQLLLQDFPEHRRKDAARRIYEILREEYGRAGPYSPDWLESLKKLVEAERR